MNRPLLVLAVLFCVWTTACGGTQKQTESPASSEADTSGDTSASDGTEQAAQADGAAPASGPWDIPNSCHNGSSPCTANPKWVKRLCDDVYPAVALYLFSSKSPFTHGYLSRKTRAVNASGGATSGDEWLAFDEEVVLLHYRAEDTGGIQVSGASGGYEAMRLDGSCVTLGAEEVRLQKPPAPKYATVPWRYIGDDMQEALRKNESINSAYMERRKECKGAFSGEVSKKCVTRDEELNREIIKALSNGTVDLPQPELRP
jgi:hypothetical protein